MSQTGLRISSPGKDMLAVSVIIPTYNRAHLIPRALGSALPQLSEQDEVLVVDDGSTDDTPRVVSAFGERVRTIRGEHRGAGAARNLGIRQATRPLIAFLDSDDEWLPDKIALERALMHARPDVLFCFSDFAARNERGIEPHYLKKWHQDSRPWEEILGPGVGYSSIASLPSGRDDFRVHFGSLALGEMMSDYVATSTCMVRRETAGDALRFAEDLPVSEDKECFGRLATAGLAAYLDCETSYQWEHAGARLTDVDTYQFASARLVLLERIWGKQADFLARHRDAFDRKRSEQYLKRARWLIVHGRTREARADLRDAGRSPWSYRLLAALPGPVVKTVLRLRRLLTGRR